MVMNIISFNKKTNQDTNTSSQSALRAFFQADFSVIVCTDQCLSLFKSPFVQKEENGLIMSQQQRQSQNNNDTTINIQSSCCLNGGPFILATAFNGLIAAVAQNDTPPYTPFFILLYQQAGVFIKSIEFPSKIINILSTPIYLFVSITRTIQVFDLRSFRSVASFENQTSSTGIFSVSAQFIAWPDDTEIGSVVIATTFDFREKLRIKCHNGELRSICLSSDGRPFILSASKKGTLIRTHDCESGKMIAENRRGYTQGTVLAMDMKNGVKCVCTATTIHIFTSTNNGSHLTATPSKVPLACAVAKDGKTVEVVTGDAMMTVYEISETCNTLTAVNRVCLESLAKRKIRRTTV